MNEQRIRITKPTIRLDGVRKLSTKIDPLNEVVSIRKSNEIVIPTSWNDIPAIYRSRTLSFSPENPEDLIHIVELPLYPSAVLLNQSGIVTTESNAHFEPEQEETIMLLGIRWDSLNEQQKLMAKKLIQEEPDRWEHITADRHGDGYEAFYLNWKINKGQVNPQQVDYYVRSSVKRLISGLIKVSK